MPRCGCLSACACSLASNSPISLSGNGAQDTPYTLGLTLDPADGNLVVVGPSGLLVKNYLAFSHVITSGSLASGSLFVAAEAPSGDVTLTLPTLATDGIANSVLTVKKVGVANNVIIEGFGAETIDGALNVVLAEQYAGVSMVPTTSFGWLIVGIV